MASAGTSSASEPFPGEMPGGKAKGGKFKLIILIVVVMLLEGGVFYFVSGGSSAPAEETAAEEEEETQLDTDVVEVPVEKFTCTNSKAAPGSIIHITIEMSAIISAKQQVVFQEAVTKSHKARIRSAILKVLRSASLEDLADPNYSTMKRLIREEINKVLRKSIVLEIIISDFSKMEQ